MPVAQKKQVIDAINKLGRKVTVADVATKTGLPVLVTAQELNKVAAETNGHLQVGTTGDIAYSFDAGFQNAYLAKGIQRTLQVILEKAFQIGFYLLRISFGIMLVLSLVIVVGLIFIAITAMNKGSNDNDRDGGFSLDFFDFMILRDLFYWGAYSTYDPYQAGYSEPRRIERRKGNFLTDCFSFLFGDGDPNRGKEERRWQLIAEAIRAHHGVITAEQLAPYTGADPKKEDGALPVLVRFNGMPEVTDTGNIVYTFPDLQMTAGVRRDNSLPTFFREWPWVFSQVPGESLIPVYVVAGLNFFGAWWLATNMNQIPVLSDFSFLISLLTVYGTLFVTIPIARLIVINVLNTKIEMGNNRRHESAVLIENPSPELHEKLLQAKKYEIKEKRLSSKDVVYSTDKDLLDQEFDASP
jgi:hypothetical protein